MSGNIFVKEIKKAIAMSDYKRLGFEQNPFLPEPTDYITSFINRHNEQSKIARYLNDLAKGRISNIALVGTSGVGKTHFLRYLEALIKKERLFEKMGFKDMICISSLDQLGDSIPDILDFSPKTKISSFIQTVITEGEPIRKTLLLLDNADQIWLKTTEITRLFDNLDKIGIVSVWRSNIWRRIKKKASFRIPKPVTLLLLPLDINICLKILKNRIELASSNDIGLNFFTDEALEEIAFLAMGNPYTLITRARGCLDMALERNVKRIDKELVADFARERGLQRKDEIKNVLDSLTSRQINIIVLMHSYGKGQNFTASVLAEKFNISRSAMVQHLQKLKDKYSLLDSIADGKTVKYYLKSPIVRFLEIEYEKLEEESELEDDILIN